MSCENENIGINVKQTSAAPNNLTLFALAGHSEPDAPVFRGRGFIARH
jgi:hypothetical protein